MSTRDQSLAAYLRRWARAKHVSSWKPHSFGPLHPEAAESHLRSLLLVMPRAREVVVNTQVLMSAYGPVLLAQPVAQPGQSRDDVVALVEAMAEQAGTGTAVAVGTVFTGPAHVRDVILGFTPAARYPIAFVFTHAAFEARAYAFATSLVQHLDVEAGEVTSGSVFMATHEFDDLDSSWFTPA